MINRIGDRILGALLPKARAEAYYCWYPSAHQQCCNYPENGGRTYCWAV